MPLYAAISILLPIVTYDYVINSLFTETPQVPALRTETSSYLSATYTLFEGNISGMEDSRLFTGNL
jgi:hypothetical protein